MRAFWVGLAAAVVLAIVTGFAVNLVEVPSASFNSTDHVRFGEEKTGLH